MKKFIVFCLVVLLALFATTSAIAQVYDGITQPTKWRVWLPVSVSTENASNMNSTPFIGYRQDVCNHFNITGVLQYNIKGEAIVPQIWLNADIKGKVYFLSRSIYNTHTNKYCHTLSATAKLPLGFHIDITWDNLYDGNGFCDTDRLQVLGGYGNDRFVFNAGYSMRDAKGFVTNLRLKLTNTQWVQLKYDGGTKQVTAALAMHFN